MKNSKALLCWVILASCSTEILAMQQNGQEQASTPPPAVHITQSTAQNTELFVRPEEPQEDDDDGYTFEDVAALLILLQNRYITLLGKW